MIIGDRKKAASIILSHLNPHSEPKMPEAPQLEEKEEENTDHEGLKAIAREALDAVKADDEHGFAMALHAFFEMCDSMPHAEGPHLEESEELESE
jgi:hypothetical protein